MRVGRERDHDAVDPVFVHQPTKLARCPEELERRAAVRVGPAVVVDEPDDVEAVAPVLPHLLGKQACDVARADDQHVLNVCRLTPSHKAEADAEERDEPDRQSPEHDEPVERGMRETGDVGSDENDPRADGHDLQHAEEVVHRGVIRSFLVSVVETVEPSKQYPNGKARQEQNELPLWDDRVGPCRPGHEPLGYDEGRHEPDDVRQQQQAPHQPPATRPPPRRPRDCVVGRCRYSLR